MFKRLSILLFLLIPVCLFAQKIDLMLLNQDYQKAIELIDTQLNVKPSANLFYKRFIAHQKLMDYPAALQDLDAALGLDSANVRYLSSQADLYQAMGNNSKAVSSFQKALSIKPDDLLLKYELGKALLYLNDYKGAYLTFEEIQTVDSTNVMFNKYSALAAYKAHKYKRAIYLYEKYISQNSNDLSAYFNISEAFEKINKESRSFEYLFRASRKFPNNRQLKLKIANNAFKNKNYDIAERVYQSYLVRYDTLPTIYLNYGICLYHNKHTKAALEVLEECYPDMPNDVYLNFYLGVCHKRLKNYDLASKYLDFAIYMSIPDFHPEMYHHLAQVYANNEKYENAIECYKKAYELDSRKVEVLFEIATTYEKYNYNKTMALNYYRNYLLEAGEGADNANYALDRIKLIKEELFMDQN